MNTKKIIYNAIKTPDGTILESFGTHDCKTHVDKNGNFYSVDGGYEYLKRSYDQNDFTELSKFDDGIHETRINNMRWGRHYDENMKRLDSPEFIKIKDMKTDHILGILKNGYAKSGLYFSTFTEELKRRGYLSQLELEL